VSRAKRVVALIASLAILVSGLLLVSTRAMAAIQVPESNPGLLSLWTDSYPLEYHDMDPGESAYVRLNVQLDDTDRGELTLEVRKSGELATVDGGLELSVERCDVDWAAVPSGVTASGAPSCASGRTMLLAAGASDDFELASPTWSLGEIANTDTVFMLVRLALPSTTPATRVSGMSASFGFGLFAEGKAASRAIVSSGLAFTGVDVVSLLLVAVGAISAGAVASGRAREKARS
jgi:hypothetical protein